MRTRELTSLDSSSPAAKAIKYADVGTVCVHQDTVLPGGGDSVVDSGLGLATADMSTVHQLGAVTLAVYGAFTLRQCLVGLLMEY